MCNVTIDSWCLNIIQMFPKRQFSLNTVATLKRFISLLELVQSNVGIPARLFRRW